jgi:hypothetical protein
VRIPGFFGARGMPDGTVRSLPGESIGPVGPGAPALLHISTARNQAAVTRGGRLRQWILMTFKYALSQLRIDIEKVIRD